MSAGKGRPRFTIRTQISSEPMPVTDWQTAERILAKLVARAFAVDHGELFGQHLNEVLGQEISGSPSTARTDAVAPAVRDGDPEEKWSVERNGDRKDRI